MSAMESAKGIVKELYPNTGTVSEKIEKLAVSLDISVADLVSSKEVSDTGEVTYVELSHWYENDYIFVGPRLFDIRDVAIDFDTDDQRANVRKVSEGLYEVDFYYYNGGTYFDEIFADNLELADRLGEGKKTQVYIIKLEDESLVHGYFMSVEEAEEAVAGYGYGVGDTCTILTLREV